MEKGPGHKTAFTPYKRCEAVNTIGPGCNTGVLPAAVIPPETCRSINNAVVRVRSARKTLDELFQALDQIELTASEQILIQDLFREATGVNAINMSQHDASATIRVCNMQAEWLTRIAAQVHNVYKSESRSWSSAGVPN